MLTRCGGGGGQVTAADISSCNPMSGVDLRPDDIIIHDMRLNYTNKVPSHVHSCDDAEGGRLTVS